MAYIDANDVAIILIDHLLDRDCSIDDECETDGLKVIFSIVMGGKSFSITVEENADG